MIILSLYFIKIDLRDVTQHGEMENSPHTSASTTASSTLLVPKNKKSQEKRVEIFKRALVVGRRYSTLYETTYCAFLLDDNLDDGLAHFRIVTKIWILIA